MAFNRGGRRCVDHELCLSGVRPRLTALARSGLPMTRLTQIPLQGRLLKQHADLVASLVGDRGRHEHIDRNVGAEEGGATCVR